MSTVKKIRKNGKSKEINFIQYNPQNPSTDGVAKISQTPSQTSPSPTEGETDAGTWDEPTTWIFLQIVLGINLHLKQVNPTIRTEIWRLAMSLFKEQLDEQNVSNDRFKAGITVDKMQKKWESLKKEYVEIRCARMLDDENGPTDFIYYEEIEQICKYDPDIALQIMAETGKVVNIPDINLEGDDKLANERAAKNNVKRIPPSIIYKRITQPSSSFANNLNNSTDETGATAIVHQQTDKQNTTQQTNDISQNNTSRTLQPNTAPSTSIPQPNLAPQANHGEVAKNKRHKPTPSNMTRHPQIAPAGTPNPPVLRPSPPVDGSSLKIINHTPPVSKPPPSHDNASANSAAPPVNAQTITHYTPQTYRQHHLSPTQGPFTQVPLNQPPQAPPTQVPPQAPPMPPNQISPNHAPPSTMPPGYPSTGSASQPLFKDFDEETEMLTTCIRGFLQHAEGVSIHMMRSHRDETKKMFQRLEQLFEENRRKRKAETIELLEIFEQRRRIEQEELLKRMERMFHHSRSNSQ